MKKIISTVLKKILITGFTLLLMLPAIAQKEMPAITQDQINKITELVKPLKDQLDKQLNADETGTYKAYLEDIQRLNSIVDAKERSSFSNKILEKYSVFFKNIWDAAKVDEKPYQAKIRRVLEGTFGRQIQFHSYLNFDVILSATDPTPLPPPVREIVPNKCIDVCTIATGQIAGDASLIAAGGGIYGNCFLATNAWGAVVGKSELYGYLRNGITIPGTFPNDSRKLRVKKNFELRQEATSFAALGFSYAETWARTYSTSEYLLSMSPVFFGSTKLNFKTITEQYVIGKADVAKSIVRSYSGATTYGASGAWCHTNCASIKWSICEEQ